MGCDHSKLLGKGQKYKIPEEERSHIRKFLESEGKYTRGDEVPSEALRFQRLQRDSEIHSLAYTRVRSRNSTSVAITYWTNGGERDFYGKIHHYLLFEWKNETYRVAFVTTFNDLTISRGGSHRINRKRPHASGRIVSTESISRKVIFYGPEEDTKVLEIPRHLSGVLK